MLKFRSGERIGLILPSAVIREGSNILINPGQPRMADVTMEVIRGFTCDSRL